MSLGQWIAAGQKEVRGEDVPLTRGNYPTYPGMEAVKEPGKLGGVEFLRWVSLVLNDPVFTKQTDGYQEITAFTRFERLGLKTGQPFDPSKLAPDIAAAVNSGIEDGRKAVMAQMEKGSGVERNGWGLSSYTRSAVPSARASARRLSPRRRRSRVAVARCELQSH